MYQFDIDFVKQMQYYAVSQLRQNEDYKKLCECIGNDYNDLKRVSEYILKCINIDEAEGIWLDYLAWLVGTSRQYFNLSEYFCVNAEHVNAPKYFFFPDATTDAVSSISDTFLRKRIKAKIAYNTSKGTRNENNFIIKNLTNASRVIIKRVVPMMLDVTLLGSGINEVFATRTELEAVIGNGVGIRNLEIQGA